MAGTLSPMGDLRIKVCGITHEADGYQAALLGADAIGLNFYGPSPRCVGPATAERILRELPPFVEAVGVFVNLSLPRMTKTVQPLGRIRTLQWHGDAAARPAGAAYPFRLIAAFAVR